MCAPTCNAINSPRRKWIERDSQILNALFCVTGLGLAPWRFRELWFLLQYRVLRDENALRHLAGIHRSWFRLTGSNQLPEQLGPHNVGDFAVEETSSAIPLPESSIPDPPLTATRSLATQPWKLDLVIWLMISNTALQVCLSGFMWGMTRYDRPSWATGLFVGLACSAAGAGALVMFFERRKVNSIEGVPVSREDLEHLEKDRERGIWHYNNINDKHPALRNSTQYGKQRRC